MRPGDIVVICCPTSPNDGKRAKVIKVSDGYDPRRDVFDYEFMTLEMLDTGQIGGIHRRYVSEVP